MGISLGEYAQQNPQQISEDEPQNESAAAMDQIAKRKTNIEQAERLKTFMLSQMKNGEKVSDILYMAVCAIGLLSDDAGFIETSKRYIDTVYKGYSAHSQLVTMAAEDVAHIDKLAPALADRTERYIDRRIKEYSDIVTKLEQAKEAIKESRDYVELIGNV